MNRPQLTWPALQWALIPLFIFGLAETVYRNKLDTSTGWYRDRVVPDGAQQLLFIGTSRTASAIDEIAFAECLSKSGEGVRVVNLGMGNSTQAIHLHALRDRVWANPNALHKTTLFIETTCGLPSFYFPDEFLWEKVRHETMPWRWYLYLDAGTVLDPRFFASANLDLEGRLKLGARMATRDLLLFRKREIVGMRWRGMATAAMEKLMGREKTSQATPESIDLRGGGGVRTDAEGIEAMGDFERQMAEALQEFDAELPPPEQTPAGALIDFALKHGANVICFNVPTHTSKRRSFEKPNFKRFAAAYTAFLEARKVPLIESKFSFSDNDFPDQSHLSGSRAAEYSRRLFAAWQETSTNPQR